MEGWGLFAEGSTSAGQGLSLVIRGGFSVAGVGR
ncbi:hypothetical protein TIFTF001_053138, partial [Ficus carica]